MFELYIGNKNYSSWSMRPWLVLKHFHIPFEEHLVAFDDFQIDHEFKQTMLKVSPTGKVPTLKHDDLVVWDSLAICEYLVEQFPHLNLWPIGLAQRAQARAICAEMHSSFQTLRTLCGMNIEADLAEIGKKHWLEQPQLQIDVHRIEGIWASRPQLAKFLFGNEFTIADAFFAPVVMRFLNYQLPVSENAQTYMKHMLTIPAIQQWISEAKAEKMFLEFQEPYRKQ